MVYHRSSDDAARIDYLLRLAKELDGCGASRDRKKFEWVLGPPPKGSSWDLTHPYRTVSGKTTGVSTCGLVALGLARILGASDPRLHQPYVIGSAMSTIRSLSREVRSEDIPAIGVIYHIPSMAGGHALTSLGLLPDGMVRTIEGGQTDGKGLQCMRIRVRKAEELESALWCCPIVDLPSTGEIEVWSDAHSLGMVGLTLLGLGWLGGKISRRVRSGR